MNRLGKYEAIDGCLQNILITVAVLLVAVACKACA